MKFTACAIGMLLSGLGASASAAAVQPGPATNAAAFAKQFVLARQADPAAQDFVGACYQHGWGAERDPKEALAWFRRSADQGYALAEDHIGTCFRDGLGVPADLSQALDWYHKAAAEGVAQAEHDLGLCSYRGLAGPPDYTQALDWFRKAAGHGNADGACMLGLCLLKGQGTPPDKAGALRWLRKAAGLGSARAEGLLGDFYAYGPGLAPEPDPGSFPAPGAAAAAGADCKKAVGWYRKSAAHGDADGQAGLAACLLKGCGAKVDSHEAARWFRKSADQGCAAGEYGLGLASLLGTGLPKSRGSAMEQLRRAADQGHGAAKKLLESQLKEAQERQSAAEDTRVALAASAAAHKAAAPAFTPYTVRLKNGTQFTGRLRSCDGATLRLLTEQGNWLLRWADVDHVSGPSGRAISLDHFRNGPCKKAAAQP